MKTSYPVLSIPSVLPKCFPVLAQIESNKIYMAHRGKQIRLRGLLSLCWSVTSEQAVFPQKTQANSRTARLCDRSLCW